MKIYYAIRRIIRHLVYRWKTGQTMKVYYAIRRIIRHLIYRWKTRNKPAPF